MCNMDQIAGYMNVKTGSLIFAYITSVSTGLLIIVIFMVMTGLNISPPSPYLDRYVFTAVMTSGLLLVFISFVFSLLLLNGLLKTSPGYVKAYVIYGVVKSIIHVILSIVMAVLVPPVAYPAFVYCFIYGIILHMIRMTYVQMTSGLVYSSTNNPIPDN